MEKIMDTEMLEIEALVAAAKAKMGPSVFKKRMAELRAVWELDEKAARIVAARRLTDARYNAARALADAVAKLGSLVATLNCADAEISKRELSLMAQGKMHHSIVGTVDAAAANLSKFRAEIEAANETLAAELCK
jgi:hypothetical protein